MLRNLSLTFGLLIGGMWMGEALLGNLGDTVIFGNLRTFHPAGLHSAVLVFVGGALALTMLAGLLAAYRSGSFSAAPKVCVWSAVIGGAITLATLMLMTALFLKALQHSPSNLKEFARSGAPDFSTFLLVDAFVAGMNHLWIGPLLGVTLGGIGAGAEQQPVPLDQFRRRKLSGNRLPIRGRAVENLQPRQLAFLASAAPVESGRA